MAELLDAMAVAATGVKAQAMRLRYVTENVANADTPGFRRKTVPFEVKDLGRGLHGVETGRVDLDPADLARIYDPGHPLADATGSYDGSNVKLIFEIADAREAQRSYEANLQMFDQARKMAGASLDLLRR
ncbi:flagellar basal body rod protein FlgC [Mangrovicoccus algicola]|uniref:Flagellar basal body rod protein FlgC n=1 Tax=Mangrovicoccus algicola TaxID=2771008 RepID=A0A8J6ZEB2_9RHOB|nr:flagellar basal body rod protein FlgC [Mangrovicoccus algicola]MBE3640226.1 flagellar basal body rod protein FlgC [Mangrovicoccus algicola]